MPALQDQQARSSLSILYVEDNPADAFLFEQALAAGGTPYSLTVLGDGEAALDFIQSSSVLPDLVVLDLNLRSVDGLTVLRALKADGRWRSVPVQVFVEASDPNHERANHLGADLCRAKPTDWDAWPNLIEAITKLGSHETARRAAG